MVTHRASVEDAPWDVIDHEESLKPAMEAEAGEKNGLEALEEQEKVVYDVVLKEEDIDKNDKPVRRKVFEEISP